VHCTSRRALALLRQGPVICFTDTGGIAAEIYRIHSSNLTAEPSETLFPGQTEEAAELIQQLLALGTDTGYNGVPQLSFFIMPEEGAKNVLGIEILNMLLNDLPTRFMEIKLSVVWAQESILTEVLERPPTEDDDDVRLGPTIALELALARKDLKLARFLLACGASPKAVHIQKLFLSVPDKYGLVASTKRAGLSSKLCHVLTSVPGYKEHLLAREEMEETIHFEHIALQKEQPNAPADLLALSTEMVPTRWTDLMMWAVCMGEHKLAETLWARSNDPMRAALLASQLCRRMSAEPHLAAESSRLEQFADRYEDLAIGLLEQFDDKDDAIASLALVPCLYTDGQAKLMWEESPLDGAAIDDGRLSVPCKRLVAHPTAQELLEGWYCGVRAP
jgi:hypothetical protein